MRSRTPAKLEATANHKSEKRSEKRFVSYPHLKEAQGKTSLVANV